MNDIRKEKLIKYLYPNEKARKFMCVELYEELSPLISAGDCISSKNFTNSIRKENMQKVQGIVEDFFSKNQNYYEKIKKIYSIESLEEVVDITIISFVFILSYFFTESFVTDIFNDKRSICYAPISVIDLV